MKSRQEQSVIETFQGSWILVMWSSEEKTILSTPSLHEIIQIQE